MKANNIIGLVYTMEGLASLHVDQRTEQAAHLFVWADALRERIGDHRPPVEQASVKRDLTVIQSQLGIPEFERLSEEGKAMTMEQAIVYAPEN